jgi:hypothetical protein
MPVRLVQKLIHALGDTPQAGKLSQYSLNDRLGIIDVLQVRSTGKDNLCA